MKLPNFKVLTGMSVMDVPYENEQQHEKDMIALVEEQDKILEANMFKRNLTECYLLHFFDSVFFDECNVVLTIYDGIEGLSIKDGYDLVQFENGNYGFVAYCNGNENGFEIIRDRYM